MSSKPLVLPTQLSALYDALIIGHDVDFKTLWLSIRAKPLTDDRNVQQALGPYITRLNRRLRQHGRQVEPGRLKGTYRLVVRA